MSDKPMVRIKTKEELTLEKIRKPKRVVIGCTKDTENYIEKSKNRLLRRKIITTDGCWIFTGHKSHSDYGLISFNHKVWSIHRLSMFLFKSTEFIEDLEVMHSCDVKACFNPEHLSMGTHCQNMKDYADKKYSPNSRKEYCKNGHEFTFENTYLRKLGGRTCRKCKAEHEAKARILGMR